MSRDNFNQSGRSSNAKIDCRDQCDFNLTQNRRWKLPHNDRPLTFQGVLCLCLSLSLYLSLSLCSSITHLLHFHHILILWSIWLKRFLTPGPLLCGLLT